MPKLKKHADILSPKRQESEPEEQKDKEETTYEQLPEESEEYKPVKRKFSDRVKIFEQQNKKRRSKKASEEEWKVSQQCTSTPQLVEDSDIDKFLSKYSEDDDITPDQRYKAKKRKSLKQNKSEIRTKNRMFKDVSFDETATHSKPEQFQQLELSVEKKEKRRQSGQLLEKFQQKADKFKNKLQFKDLSKDVNYQKKISETLKEIKEDDQLNLIVEIPKLFAGNNKSEVETALFLKNTKQKSTQEITEQHKELDESSLNKNQDRKSHFEELNKMLKMKKTQTFTQSVLKDRFKKSILEDGDYIYDFKDTNNKIKPFDELSESDYSYKMKAFPAKEKRQSKPKEKQMSPKQNTNTNTNLNQSKTNFKKEESKTNKRLSDVSIKSAPEDTTISEQQDISLLNNSSIREKKVEDNGEQSKFSTQQSNSRLLQPIIYKQPQEKNIKKKIKQFKYNNLIEYEAEESDDEQQGGPKHHDEGEQSETDDDTNLHSLIDDNVEVDEKDEHRVHRKYIADVIEEQEKKFEEMRKKIEKKYIQEEEMMKKRMEQAAKRNKEKQKEQEKFYCNNIETNQQSISVATSNSTARKAKNEEKLKELDLLIGGEKKTEKEENYTKIGSASSQLDILEKALFGTQHGMKKAERKGLHNSKIQRQSKPKIMKRPTK